MTVARPGSSAGGVGWPRGRGMTMLTLAGVSKSLVPRGWGGEDSVEA